MELGEGFGSALVVSRDAGCTDVSNRRCPSGSSQGQKCSLPGLDLRSVPSHRLQLAMRHDAARNGGEDARHSRRLGFQEVIFGEAERQGVLWWRMALRMERNFRMQAVRATLGKFAEGVRFVPLVAFVYDYEATGTCPLALASRGLSSPSCMTVAWPRKNSAMASMMS